MLDAESVASEGQFDEALLMMDKIIAGADPSDTMSTIIKANILMQKVKLLLHITFHRIEWHLIASYVTQRIFFQTTHYSYFTTPQILLKMLIIVTLFSSSAGFLFFSDEPRWFR